MKGGVAAMVFAVEALARLGVPTAGDILVNTVTDEESTGAGALATAARGLRADAGIVPEPTGLDVWTACRGSVLAGVTVRGRAGHAGLSRPGGGNRAVNAIDKAALLLAALAEVRDDWARREEDTHPLLGAGDIVPTSISAGGWLVAHPAKCRFELHVSYLPAQADADGWSERVRVELADRLGAAAAADPWLREHPPELDWLPGGVPPADVPPTELVVALARTAAADVGRSGRLATRTTWYDGATFTRAGIPTIAFGPGNIARAHAVDEHVEVDELVASAQSLALVALRFCGQTARPPPARGR
jgi:acetylornithine deacetylase